MGYRERVCKFGSHGGLIGILTEPVGETRELTGAHPAIVVSNVGLNHRPGPNRLWVEFARRMAEKGFITLRFDLSGLGDSTSRCDNLSTTERHNADTREAVEFVLQKKQLSRVALIGLCSGVDPAHAVALEDPRVSHAFFLDGYHYDTSRHLFNIRFLKLIQPRYYARGLRRWLQRIPGERKADAEGEILTREYPVREKMRQDIDVMLARGVQMYFCFSGGFAHYYSYENQFFDMLPKGESLRGKVSLNMFPQADHLFGGVELKEDLYQSLERFLLKPVEQPSSESC
jgi:hypothetical protein